MKTNAIYAQSGGVTSVINVSALGVINAWNELNPNNGTLYAGRNGILGVLNDDLIDISQIPPHIIKKLRHTPGGSFGSCRYKLKDLKTQRLEYEKLINVFHKHNIGYFFYNGGNDSADTCLKVSQISQELNYPIKAIHIPKTIDNDLMVTDNCPGFGSVAKYIATSIMEAGLDLRSMCSTSTKVFILEVMGRNAGWIAASAALANTMDNDAPHIILLPECTFDSELFLNRIEEVINNVGHCVVVASEGIKYSNGKFVSESVVVDAFGHAQLGGVANILAQLVSTKLNLKCHFAISDYLQRSARHLASSVDVEQAYKVGYYGVKYALEGKNAVMPYIKRISNTPYQWEIDCVDLTQVANLEKRVPDDFIDKEKMHIRKSCLEYLRPLILGEDYPPFIDGLPDYTLRL